MSHGVICASVPALSLGIIREATTVKFLPRSALAFAIHRHIIRTLAHHIRETTVSEAIEQLKANPPTHPPVDSLKPLDEDHTGLRILAVHAHPDDSPLGRRYRFGVYCPWCSLHGGDDDRRRAR